MTIPRYSFVNSSRISRSDEIGLLVEELGRLRLRRERGDLLPLVAQPLHVAFELVAGRALGRGAHDQPRVGRTQPIEDPAESLALVVG